MGSGNNNSLERMVDKPDLKEILVHREHETFSRLASMEARAISSGDSQFMEDFKYIENELCQKTIDKYTDSMTGILNREAIDVELDRLVTKYTAAVPLFNKDQGQKFMKLENAGRRDLTRELEGTDRRHTVNDNIYFAVLDIDHFGNFNNTYGHQVGDDVLISFANVVRDSLRDGKIMRYGGEEFTVILNAANEQDAHKVFDRVRQNVEEKAYQGIKLADGSDLAEPITVSIGFTTYDFMQGENAEIAFKRADDAVYESKDNGRNRVSYHGLAV